MQKYVLEDQTSYVLQLENGKRCLNREDGPAIINHEYGITQWLIHGKRHRLNGPAYETDDGYKAWFIDGKRHRLDGPAIEWWNGDRQWWIDDTLLSCTSPEEFARLIRLKAFW